MLDPIIKNPNGDPDPDSTGTIRLTLPGGPATFTRLYGEPITFETYERAMDDFAEHGCFRIANSVYIPLTLDWVPDPPVTA